MSLLCVTNSMRGVKSCTIYSQHSEHCDGWRGDKECKGCLPRKASNGCLCVHCWERVITTMSAWDHFLKMIDGVEKLVVHDNGGVRGKAGSRIPIPATWLDVDEVDSHLYSFRSSGENLNYWVASIEGAKDAINFCIVAERVLSRNPIEEKPHKVTRSRCSECKQQSLVWIPTQYLGDEVKVICQNEECRHEMDQSTFELLALNEGVKN